MTGFGLFYFGDTNMPPLKPQPSASPFTATTDLLFHPGQVVTTPGALATMHQHLCSPLDLLQRHLRGDWGDVPADDAALNVEALRYGNRLLSSYRITQAVTIWLITEADRSYTTFLLPAEY